MLKQPDDNTQEIYRFFSATVQEDLEVMQHVLAKGTPVDTLHPLRHTTALMEATRLGRNQAALMLLSYGAVPGFLCGARSTSPLHIAIRQNNLQLAKQFLAYINQLAITDHAGRTPMHVLVQYVPGKQQKEDWLHMAEEMLQKSVHVDALDHEGITALHYALIHEWSELAELLLSYGANPNALVIDSGVSPLHMAALNRQTAMVKLLLRYGASPNIPAADGKTALQIMPAIKKMMEMAQETPVVHVSPELVKPAEQRYYKKH